MLGRLSRALSGCSGVGGTFRCRDEGIGTGGRVSSLRTRVGVLRAAPIRSGRCMGIISRPSSLAGGGSRVSDVGETEAVGTVIVHILTIT